MAKKQKPPDADDFPAPLNMSEDLEDMTVIMSGCTTVRDSPLLGTFTVVTQVGHYDFIIDEEMANEMIQALREFLAGDSAPLLDDPG